jgi:hypothetical protein
MTSAPDNPIAWLRRVAAAAAAGEALETRDGERLAGCLGRFFELGPRGGTMDLCFGVSPMQGGESCWRQEKRSDRNALMIEAAARCLPDIKPSYQARTLVMKLHRYQLGRWRSDQRRADPPAEYMGQLDYYLFQLLKHHEELPGERQIQRVLEEANYKKSA